MEFENVEILTRDEKVKLRLENEKKVLIDEYKIIYGDKYLERYNERCICKKNITPVSDHVKIIHEGIQKVVGRIIGFNVCITFKGKKINKYFYHKDDDALLKAERWLIEMKNKIKEIKK